MPLGRLPSGALRRHDRQRRAVGRDRSGGGGSGTRGAMPPLPLALDQVPAATVFVAEKIPLPLQKNGKMPLQCLVVYERSTSASRQIRLTISPAGSTRAIAADWPAHACMR